MSMNNLTGIFIVAISLLLAVTAPAQKLTRDQIEQAIEKDGCVVTEEGTVKICKFDYKYKGQNVEAWTFRPAQEGRYPAVMLIPGHEGTAKSFATFGIIFARLGFASLSVGTPGFGKTELKADFLGKRTINAYITGYKTFARESFVDKDKIAVFGYSRGAIAASLMITRIKNVKAAVLGGGVYDLKKAYDELTIKGIKENIKTETGLTDKAFKERSSVFHMKNLNCPVLIIHGENDTNAPTNQAYLLRDKLKELNKDFEFLILADHRHGFFKGSFINPVADFLSRKLKGEPLRSKIT